MQKKKNHKTAGLTKKTVLSEAAKLVMEVKIFNLLSAINKFFEQETVENLHSIRIALRRVRYSLETFAICFNKKKYHSFYKKLAKLQDLSGLARDLDVLTDNMNKLHTELNIKISNRIFGKIEDNKTALKEKLKLELLQFIHGKSLKDFQSLLSRKN
ncbi:MAG: CHAD domain-containing protein [Ignavibacteriales bacterium]|nr:MAG: CHAD domain-containing protein [Ignavibacteriales bacterium]